MIARLRHQRLWMSERLARVDGSLLQLAHLARSGPVNQTAVGISHLGRGGLIWLGLAPLVSSRREALSRPRSAVISMAAIACTFGASTVLARALDRTRPCERGTRPLVPCPEGGSFPSDQVAAAFAAAEMLGRFEPRARTWIIGGAALVAISRVVVGVHYPSDVAGGALIGVSIGRAAAMFAERRGGGPGGSG